MISPNNIPMLSQLYHCFPEIFSFYPSVSHNVSYRSTNFTMISHYIPNISPYGSSRTFLGSMTGAWWLGSSPYLLKRHGSIGYTWCMYETCPSKCLCCSSLTASLIPPKAEAKSMASRPVPLRRCPQLRQKSMPINLLEETQESWGYGMGMGRSSTNKMGISLWFDDLGMSEHGRMDNMNPSVRCPHLAHREGFAATPPSSSDSLDSAAGRSPRRETSSRLRDVRWVVPKNVKLGEVRSFLNKKMWFHGM